MIERREILLALQSSLLGMITPSVRAIAFSYNRESEEFLLQYYLDHEPLDKDYENVEVVLTEFISHFKFSDFSRIDSRCIYTTEALNRLDHLDGFVYMRQEGQE